jgi:hypothetical protein
VVDQALDALAEDLAAVVVERLLVELDDVQRRALEDVDVHALRHEVDGRAVLEVEGLVLLVVGLLERAADQLVLRAPLAEDRQVDLLHGAAGDRDEVALDRRVPALVPPQVRRDGVLVAAVDDEPDVAGRRLAGAVAAGEQPELRQLAVGRLPRAQPLVLGDVGDAGAVGVQRVELEERVPRTPPDISASARIAMRRLSGGRFSRASSLKA